MSRKSISLADWDMVENIKGYRDCLGDMLKLIGQTAPGNGEDDREEELICTSLAQDICRKCPGYRTCYGEERDKTLLVLKAILREMAPELEAASESEFESHTCPEKLLPSFRRKCVYYSSLIEEMTWLCRLIYQNRFWRKRMEVMRQSIYSTLAAQQGLLDQCVGQIEQGMDLDRAKVRFLNRRLFIRGCRVKKARERRVPAEGPEVILDARLAGARQKTLFEEAVSALYGRKMVCGHPGLWIPAGRQKLLFSGEPHFYVTFGKIHRSKNGDAVCGDSFSFVSPGRGQAVCCLADGMGTGLLAYESSSRLIEAYESMLAAGISEQAAMEMLHALLSLETGQEVSTLDTASISLTTGIVSLIKAGGAATFIRHKDRVERISSRSLPLGYLEQPDHHMEKRKLYDGDRIVMVSDGMLAFENSEGQEVSMESILMDIDAMNAQTYAEQVMRKVPMPQDGSEDDRTVLVATVWER